MDVGSRRTSYWRAPGLWSVCGPPEASGPSSADTSGSDQPELPPDLAERVEGRLEIRAAVRGGDLAAHAGLALGHDRIAEPCHEDPFIQQHVAHLDGEGG